MTAFEGIRKEMTASMVLNVKNGEDRAHNQAMRTALQIVKRYEKGEGLFQYKH